MTVQVAARLCRDCYEAIELRPGGPADLEAVDGSQWATVEDGPEPWRCQAAMAYRGHRPTLSDEQIEDIVDRFEFRPLGQHGFEVKFFRDEDGVATLEGHHLTYDARDDRFWEEWWPDDELPKEQTFTATLFPHEYADAAAVKNRVLVLVAQAMAHEALEWARWNGAIVHDPHVDGDAEVTVG